MKKEAKKIRLKSPKFPAMALDKAIEVIKEASKLGKSFQQETFASFGLRRDAKGSTKSGAFLRRIAALKYFGLIEAKGNQIELTKITDLILYPKDDQERVEAIKESFLRPILFKKLYDAIEKEVPIKKEYLASMAVREYGITPKAVEVFVSSFINSAKFAGLLKFTDDRDSIILTKTDSTPLGLEEMPRKLEETPREKAREEAWSTVINQKDKEGNYELLFHSKESVSTELWSKLKEVINILEEEFKQGKKEASEKGKKETLESEKETVGKKGK